MPKRAKVCVSKSTFNHPCEVDGVTILDVEGLYLEWVPQSDGNGGTQTNKDGSEHGIKCVVLKGDL